MYKSAGAHVGVSTLAEPVCFDDAVIEIIVVCVGKMGSRRFEIK